jgi:hypothetical protein
MFATLCCATPWLPHLGQRSVGSVGAGTWIGMTAIYARRGAASYPGGRDHLRGMALDDRGGPGVTRRIAAGARRRDRLRQRLPAVVPGGVRLRPQREVQRRRMRWHLRERDGHVRRPRRQAVPRRHGLRGRPARRVQSRRRSGLPGAVRSGNEVSRRDLRGRRSATAQRAAGLSIACRSAAVASP